MFLTQVGLLHILLELECLTRLGLLCDLLWSDPDKDITGWSENDRGVSFTFGPDVVSRFLQKHDMDLICRAHQVCCEIWAASAWAVCVLMTDTEELGRGGWLRIFCKTAFGHFVLSA